MKGIICATVLSDWCWDDREETRLVTVPLRAVQLLIGESINVDVGPTKVAVAGPSNSTLRGGRIYSQIRSNLDFTVERELCKCQLKITTKKIQIL